MLSSARIFLRPLEPIDVDTLYRWENDPEIWTVGNTIAPYSRKMLWEYVDTYEADIFKSRQLRFMIALTDSHETVGTIDLFDFDPINSRVGIGIFVVPSCRETGIAAEALGLVEEYCRRRLTIHQMYCTIAATNAASRALFSSSGFVISGCLRSWLREGGSFQDAYFYQKFLN